MEDKFVEFICNAGIHKTPLHIGSSLLPLRTLPPSTAHKQVRFIPDQSLVFVVYFTDDIEPSLQEIAIEKVLQQERRLQEKEESRRIEANASDDVSIWHKFMQWTDTFRDKDLAVRKKKTSKARAACC